MIKIILAHTLEIKFIKSKSVDTLPRFGYFTIKLDFLRLEGPLCNFIYKYIFSKIYNNNGFTGWLSSAITRPISVSAKALVVVRILACSITVK